MNRFLVLFLLLALTPLRAADVKISALPAATSASSGDIFPFTQISTTATKGITLANLKTSLGIGNVENTALSTWTGTASLIQVGTLTTGAWHATAIGDAYISSAATWNAKQSALTAGVDYLAPSAGGVWVGTTYTLNRMNVAISPDGKTWKYAEVPNSFSPGGQDVAPLSMCKIGDLWYIFYATSAAKDASYVDDSFGVASSPDLVTWTAVTDVDCSSLSGIQAAWPTCAYQDPADPSYTGLHIFFTWSPNWTTDTGFVIAEVHPTNAALSTWSAPVNLGGTGFPNNAIDPFVVKIGANYILQYKNENTKYLAQATSTSLTSGYTQVHDGTADFYGYGSSEAPKLVKISASKWRLYFDDFDGAPAVEYYAESTDSCATFGTKTAISTAAYHQHLTPIYTQDFGAMRNILGLAIYAMEPQHIVGSMDTAGIVSITGNSTDFTSGFLLRLRNTSSAANHTGWLAFDNETTPDATTANASGIFQYSHASTDGNADALGFWNYKNGPLYLGTNNLPRVLITGAGDTTIYGATTFSSSLAAAGAATLTGGLILPTSTTPASASAAGVAGTVCRDGSFIYVCVATNTWTRVAIASW